MSGTRLPLLALALGLVLALAACADTPVTAPAPASPAPTPADVAQADTGFAQMMVPHHEQALELATLVRGRSASPEVADLAFRIDREQVEEVGQLRGFLGLRDAAPSAMHDMAGMADDATLDRLRAARGPAFDRLWLATMTAHHEGALAMAREYLGATDGRGGLAEFARTLLVTQQAEIERMAQAR